MNCYILTGGRSRRMGRSKTALFFDRVAAAARPVFDDVIAVERDGGETRAIRTIFEERHDDEAAIFGVLRAMRDAGGRCFVLAVDYPLITSDVLRFLHERGGVPVWNGEPQLLCAVWDGVLLPALETRIAMGRFDLRGLVEHDMIAEAELRERFRGEPLMNVNTPEELEAAERLYGG